MPYEADAVAEPATQDPDRPTAYNADDLHIARHLIRDLTIHFTAAGGDPHAGHRSRRSGDGRASPTRWR